MAKQTTYNAGIYVRLSKDDERAGESLSIENQKLILTKYCAEQGWNIVDIYVDDGYSGTSFDRPAVQKLLEDAITVDEFVRYSSAPREIHIYYKLLDKPLKDRRNLFIDEA